MNIASDAVLEEAHRAMADFYNAAAPEEIIFGSDMTTLTLYFSRSISSSRGNMPSRYRPSNPCNNRAIW